MIKAAFLRLKEGKVHKAIMVNGKVLNYMNFKLESQDPIVGKVLQMNREIKGGGWLVLDQKLPTDGSLVGSQITMETQGERDASYTIHNIQRLGKKSKIFCGPITFVTGNKGGHTELRSTQIPMDYSQNYRYDFEEGATFKIDVHKEWTAGE